MEELEIDRQQQAIDLVKKGYNLFITGSGGVGKSWLIDQISDDHTVLCAPMGISALNIGGMTCHKTFGLPIGFPTEDDYEKVPHKVDQLFANKSVVKRIVIDEIGMVRADSLDLINARLQLIRRNKLPFGGIQMVVVGDFFQLEAIIGNRERDIYYTYYDSPFCFTSHSWDFPMIELKKVYRQEDKTQVKILNEIRKKGQHFKIALDAVEQLSTPYSNTIETLHLTCYKDDAARINNYWYNQIEEEEFVFECTKSGHWSPSEYPVDQTMRLKVGSRVVISANCPSESYCNGDRGVITEFNEDTISVDVDNEHDEERIVHVDKFKWEKYGYMIWNNRLSKEVVASFEQFPIQLGWGITIHKCQGMTLDGVALDVGRGCFSHGQLYTGISRIRDLKKMSLVVPVSATDLIVKPEVQEFYLNPKRMVDDEAMMV